MKVTIVYTFRNRDIVRIKRTLDSMALQSDMDFTILFIDYGTKDALATEVRLLVERYSFVKYYYLYTQYQPWNKSKALNYALRQICSPYFFVADIDMIFHYSFISKVKNLIQENPLRNIYFKVGFLSESTLINDKKFENLSVHFESTNEATGLSLFLTDNLKKLNGFDEFYHFWGAEDTDAHIRLKNAGDEVYFYDSEILMLHQWHPSYRSAERKALTVDLQLSGIVQLNHEHLKDTIAQKRTKLNNDNWGQSISKEKNALLDMPVKKVIIKNHKSEIDHFLYFTLKHRTVLVTEYLFERDFNQGSLRQLIKKLFRKKIPKYYSLKEINDLILLNLVSDIALKNYRYQVAPDLKSISLTL